MKILDLNKTSLKIIIYSLIRVFLRFVLYSIQRYDLKIYLARIFFISKSNYYISYNFCKYKKVHINFNFAYSDTSYTYSILWCKYNGTYPFQFLLQKIIFGTCACVSQEDVILGFSNRIEDWGYMNEVTTKLTLAMAYDNI